MRKKLAQIRIALREIKRDFHSTGDAEFAKSRLEADIIRNVHSIEKGLCLENPRKGFGIAKISKLFELSEAYLSLKPADLDCLYFIVDGVSAYLDFHSQIGFENDDIKKIRESNETLKKKLPERNEVYGGISTISVSDMDFDMAEIEKLFNTRHSVREFSGESVDDETIQKAIRLAQRCPSACNRQGVRIYSVKGDKFLSDIEQNLEGVGGFAQDVDSFLVITGKQSAYSIDEKNQFAVSASIFAGYLTLALHAYKVGACVIQRPLIPREYWSKFRKKNQIPEDEQIVMLIGIGKYKETTKVPLSKRFDVDKIYRKLDK